ncbi:hypothetical protein VPNG_06742 [Cytospora leucostoma]|uniref:Uncharacterized protein n=1 Tax=Cytospora leucostoma TaxID=1230097 RepID=A0A423WTR7_9PEZI|nr:hypothetical protein VPNG_06742 [Cytospora leucostoma]
MGSRRKANHRPFKDRCGEAQERARQNDRGEMPSNQYATDAEDELPHTDEAFHPRDYTYDTRVPQQHEQTRYDFRRSTRQYRQQYNCAPKSRGQRDNIGVKIIMASKSRIQGDRIGSKERTPPKTSKNQEKMCRVIAAKPGGGLDLGRLKVS